jgi:uncharacterized delta-60 repeat protein
MALQPDGKIVLVGGACGIAGIARYNSNGTLDSGFGTGGKTQVQAFPPYQGGTNVSGIALDSAGKIVVVGNDGVGHPFVLRLTTSGALDSSFGSAGIVTFSTSVVKTVAIDGNDKVLVGTAPPNGLTQPNLYRVNTDGSLDTGFGTGGIATLQATPASIVLQSDGRIVVVGNANLFLGGMMNMYGVVERRLSDGSNDPAYHFGGMVPALDSFWNFGVPDGAGTVVAVGTSVPYQSAYTVGRYLLGPTS